MRVLCLPPLTLTLLAVTACDSGQSSIPPDGATNSAAQGPVTVTSDTVATNTVTSTVTSTSTTGSPPPPGGFVYQTGRGCTPGVMNDSGQLQGQWGRTKVNIGGLEYFLQINEWNSTAPQTMTYGGGVFFRMTTQAASSPTTEGPTGFPSIFVGGNAGNITSNSNLPKQVATLTSVPTTWDWNDAGTLDNLQMNSYNATYDVWFSVGADGEPNATHPSGAFLMVWYHKPFDVQPIGSVSAQGATVANVPGTWNVWLGVNNNTPVVSYTPSGTIGYMDFDLNDFIKDAVQRGGSVQNSHYLTNIFAGFEIWRGGVNLETTSFCAQVL